MMKLKFIKLPINEETGLEDKDFEEMLGHSYKGDYSSFGKGIVLWEGLDEESEKAYENCLYKSLMSTGWYGEETARAMATGEEELDMCLYFNEDCFERLYFEQTGAN